MNLLSIKSAALIAMVGSGLVLNGCLTNEDKKDPNPVVDSLKTTTVTLGAQENQTLGSFLDLDANFKVMKLDVANANDADVDLLFAYSGTAKAAAFYSPDSAKKGIGGGAGLTIAKDLDPANHIEIKKVDASKLAAAKTQAELDALHAGGVAAANGRQLISNGEAFTAKSSKGVIFGITVTTLTLVTGLEPEGTVLIKGFAK